MAVTIITNGHERLLLNWDELTPKEQEKLGGKLNDDENDFIRYKDEVYRIADFIVMTDMTHYPEWDGVITDTFFSGILIRLCNDDADRVIMGRYYSTD